MGQRKEGTALSGTCCFMEGARLQGISGGHWSKSLLRVGLAAKPEQAAQCLSPIET